MITRPTLSKNLNADVFLTYYYLKNELVQFCKDNGLPTSDGKQELTKRIAHFLKTGEALPPLSKKKIQSTNTPLNISLDSIIEAHFVCSEIHRSFFKRVIGTKFTFNVAFQKYLKSHAGHTYHDAVNAWYRIQEEKKQNKGLSKIDSQFEYNTYIRDFFKDNSSKTLGDGIKCWKYKKGLPGHNKYEKEDVTKAL